jgi:putative membrane protein
MVTGMKTVKARQFFTEAERERIRQAVEAAEAATSGEIATMVVDRSNGYGEAETLGAVLCAAFVGLVVAVASHHVTIWSYVPFVFILFFPARWLISRVPALQRPFIGRRRLHAAVRDRAVRAFYEKGLYRTRHETGVLIFISLFERKVWILGDRGINAKIAPESWRQLAGTVAMGIRDGRGCDELCTVIARCGEELARHFPRQADDTNELPDEVLA